jgi:hypothetical protein
MGWVEVVREEKEEGKPLKRRLVRQRRSGAVHSR